MRGAGLWSGCKVFVHQVQSKETHLFRQITKQGCGHKNQTFRKELLMVRRSDALTVLHVFGVEDVAASLQSCSKYQCIVDVIAISQG